MLRSTGSTNPQLFKQAKDYVTSLGGITFDNIPVGQLNGNDYTIKQASDDIIFAMRLLGGDDPTVANNADGTPNTFQNQMKGLYDAKTPDEIYKFINDFLDYSINDTNIANFKNLYNIVKVHLLFKRTNA